MNKTPLPFRLLILLVAISCNVKLDAILDFAMLSFKSFGTTSIDRVVRFSDGKFASLQGQETKVFSLAGSTLTFEQTINRPTYYRFVIPAGVDTIYAIDLYNNVEIYRYNPTDGLSLLDTFDCNDPAGQLSICTFAQLLNGNLILGSVLYYDDSDLNYCLSIYNFSNPHSPALVSRVYTSEHNRWAGVFYLGTQYYYLGAKGHVYCSQDITTNPNPIAVPDLNNVTIKACKAIGGDIYAVLSDSIDQAHLTKLVNNGPSVSIAWMQDLSITDNYDFPDISGNYVYLTGSAGSNVWKINKYLYSDSASWQLVDTGSYPGLFYYKLFRLTDGFFAAGGYQSFLLNDALDQTDVFNQSVAYLVEAVYLNRYLVTSEFGGVHGDQIGYKIYDLETESFLNYESNGFYDNSFSRYGADKIVFVSNSIEVVELSHDGDFQVICLPNIYGINQVDVYDNMLAMCGYYNGQWRLWLYQITDAEAIFLSESILPHICSGIQFYDSSHFYIYQVIMGDESHNYFYKILTNYNISFLTEITSLWTANFIHNDQIMQPCNNGLVISVSDPDSPVVTSQITLRENGGGNSSFDGIRYYLFNEFFCSYVLNVELGYIDYIPGINLWFYDSARILNPSVCGVVEARVNALVDIQDDCSDPVPQLVISCYPNPFKSTTTITFSLQKKLTVKISIYNLRGQKVKDLVMPDFIIGKQQVVWDGTDNKNQLVGSGIYFIRLEFDGNTATDKVILLK